jgi:hypothetical protein
MALRCFTIASWLERALQQTLTLSGVISHLTTVMSLSANAAVRATILVVSRSSTTRGLCIHPPPAGNAF